MIDDDSLGLGWEWELQQEDGDLIVWKARRRGRCIPYIDQESGDIGDTYLTLELV